MWGIDPERSAIRTLNSEFTAAYGQPVMEFITGYRFQRARTTIQNTTIPLKVLAELLGYSHVNNFINAFRKKYGYPPGALRKK